MIEIGKINRLMALRETSVGMFLNEDAGGPEEDDILLPNKYVPADLHVGEEIDVFVYTDSEDRIIATTIQPKIKRNEFAFLQCVAVTTVGAFLDWGLEKDLFVPFKEQRRKMEVGRRYVVFLYLDYETNRLVASTRLNRFIIQENVNLEPGQEVELLAYEATDLGMNVIINNRYRGLVYASETFRRLYPGDRLKGYIRQIRPDNRVDVSLEPLGFARVQPSADRILEALREADGFLPLNDDSAPDDIYRTLEMSKKAFKQAIGGLYRAKRIRIEPDGIHLIKPR